MVPSLLHSFYPNVSDQCWRCNKAEGMMTHIWWSCPRIQPFWITVIDLIYRITRLKLNNKLSPLLLFMIPPPIYVVKNSLVSFLMIAAKMVIPRLWKTPVAPAITDWFKEVFYIQCMEEPKAESHKTSSRNAQIWGDWITFCSTPG